MDRHSSPSSEALCRRERIVRRMDFQRCYQQGRKRHGSLVTLHFHPNEQPGARLGITASRKVGKAVVRHRLKRRVREIFRRWPGRSGLPAVDIVVHLKPAVAVSSFGTLRDELERGLTGLAGPRQAASVPAQQ